MTSTLLDKLVGRTVQTVFCSKCNIFINLLIGEEGKKCPSCDNDDLEHAVIKIIRKQERAETLKEIVSKINF